MDKNQKSNNVNFLCCDFKVGDKVNTPYGEGVVYKVTDKSIHVKHWDEKRGMWLFSKYLTDPWHHSQNSVSVLSHCDKKS